MISRRNVQLIQGTLGRSYLRCSRYDMAQLLLGHLDVRDAIAAGRLATSTRVALEHGGGPVASAAVLATSVGRYASRLIVRHAPPQVSVQESLDAAVEHFLETAFGVIRSGRP